MHGKPAAMKLQTINDIHDSPGYLLRRSGQLVSSIFDATLGQSGITSGQMTVLLAIHMEPGLQQRELANELNWDEATLGGMIKRLEASGYIKRQSSTRSTRGREIYMTEEGAAFLKEIRPGIHLVQKKLLSNLTQDESQQLLFLLSKLVGVRNSHFQPAEDSLEGEVSVERSVSRDSRSLRSRV